MENKEFCRWILQFPVKGPDWEIQSYSACGLILSNSGIKQATVAAEDST